MIRSRQIRKEVASILTAVKDSLSEQDVAHATELLEHDEWGVALSLICTQLYEYEIPVSAITFEQIKAVALLMQLPEPEWNFVRKLIQESV
jgi:hypothetical protein